VCLTYVFCAVSRIFAGENIEEPRTPNVASDSVTNKKTGYCTKDHPCFNASLPNPVNEKDNQQSDPKKTDNCSEDACGDPIPRRRLIFIVLVHAT
jgi:hypothetical protein